MLVEIICIEKTYGNHYNKHEAIKTYGWWDVEEKKTVKAPRNTMVSWIESDVDNHKAFVTDKYSGEKAYCYVRKNSYGTKFLQTYADGNWRDNLLQLSECT